jgi:hypothetical protein
MSSCNAKLFPVLKNDPIIRVSFELKYYMLSIRHVESIHHLTMFALVAAERCQSGGCWPW